MNTVKLVNSGQNLNMLPTVFKNESSRSVNDNVGCISIICITLGSSPEGGH